MSPTTMLALPPPRETLLEGMLSSYFMHRPRGFWTAYHTALMWALCYETSLLPSEKDEARWKELVVRCQFAAQCIGYYDREAQMNRRREAALNKRAVA